jgi:hypothetical protein
MKKGIGLVSENIEGNRKAGVGAIGARTGYIYCGAAD